MYITEITPRRILFIHGTDAATFLQGLITQDIHRVHAQQAAYGAFLTPQGKFLHDFCITAQGRGYALEVEHARLADLHRRFMLYRLRADVQCEPQEDQRIYALWGDSPEDTRTLCAQLDAPAHSTAAAQEGAPAGLCWQRTEGMCYADPRSAALGLRIVSAHAMPEDIAQICSATAVPYAAYERHRIRHVVPDGSRDMTPERALPLHFGLDRLRGVDFDKGCYIGQEVTARSHYRGTLRKALYALRCAEGAHFPHAGDTLQHEEKKLGQMCSSSGTLGLALLAREEAETLKAADKDIIHHGIKLRILNSHEPR